MKALFLGRYKGMMKMCVNNESSIFTEFIPGCTEELISKGEFDCVIISSGENVSILDEPDLRDIQCHINSSLAAMIACFIYSKPVILISSTLVYGHRNVVSSEDSLASPDCIAGYFLRAIEDSFNFFTVKGMCGVIVRFPYLYGNGMDGQSFVGRMINQCLKNEAVDCGPSGYGMNMLYTGDAFDVIMSFAERLLTRKISGSFNVPGRWVYLSYVFEVIKQLVKSESAKCSSEEMLKNPVRVASCRTMWAYSDFRSTLKTTVDWFKGQSQECLPRGGEKKEESVEIASVPSTV